MLCGFNASALKQNVFLKHKELRSNWTAFEAHLFCVPSPYFIIKIILRCKVTFFNASRFKWNMFLKSWVSVETLAKHTCFVCCRCTVLLTIKRIPVTPLWLFTVPPSSHTCNYIHSPDTTDAFTSRGFETTASLIPFASREWWGFLSVASSVFPSP